MWGDRTARKPLQGQSKSFHVITIGSCYRLKHLHLYSASFTTLRLNLEAENAPLEEEMHLMEISIFSFHDKSWGFKIKQHVEHMHPISSHI